MNALQGLAHLPGGGPAGRYCGTCSHFLTIRGTASGKALKKGRCLRWLDFRGRQDLADGARRGDLTAIQDVKMTAPPMIRATRACKEFA